MEQNIEKKEETKVLAENEKKHSNRKWYITFSDRMSSVHAHTGGKIDPITNEVMQMCTVRVPSKEYRSHRFGVDANGIDRDSREAYINVVNSYVYDNVREGDGSLINHFTYLDPERQYNVNFKGKLCGQIDGKNQYDKPEKALISGKELCDLYAEAEKIGKEKRAERERKKKYAELDRQKKEAKAQGIEPEALKETKKPVSKTKETARKPKKVSR